MATSVTPSWEIRTFSELTSHQLYHILSLRERVFIIEQQCFFQDLDGKDDKAFHLWGNLPDSGFIAYSRIFLPGVLYESASLGRVLSAPEHRGKGLGKAVVDRALKFLSNHTPSASIRIAAQQHLTAFYADFGFTEVSAPYLDDGIWHVDMIRWPI